MTTDRFDRTVAGLFASVGRPDASDLVADVLAATSQVEQRRPLVGRFGRGLHVVRVAGRSPALRLALVALLLVGLAVAMVVGSRLLDKPQLVPVPPIVPSAPAEPSASIPPASEGVVPFAVGRRSGPALARLADGRILVAGGATVVNGSPETLRSAEIVDLGTRRSTPTGSLGVAREQARALTLADGRVLVAGGFQDTAGSQPTLASAEIFDPVTGTFTPLPDLSGARGSCHCGIRFHVLVQMRMTLLPNGTVLVAGGQPFQGGKGSVADLVDPVSATVRTVGLGCDASRGAQTSLADGRVLVICYETRTNDTDVNRAVIFDPVSGAVTTPAQPLTGSAGAATLLVDGRVLLTGSAADQLSPSAEVFDVAADTWTKVPGTLNPTGFSIPIALSDGRIAFGDPSHYPSLVFDPHTNAFTNIVVPEPDLAVAPVDLGNGSIAVVAPDDTGLMTISLDAAR